jgi:hypothetical protein
MTVSASTEHRRITYEESCASHAGSERYNIAVDVGAKHPRDELAMIHEPEHDSPEVHA